MSDSAPIPETIADQSLGRSDIEALVRRGRPVALIAVDLEEADLSRLDLTGWSFERCVLKQASLKGARLERTGWTGCRGGFADFTAADLTEAVFRSGDFNNAVLRGATLTGAKITGCKLTGADLSEARTLGATFEETLLIAAKLRRGPVPGGDHLPGPGGADAGGAGAERTLIVIPAEAQRRAGTQRHALAAGSRIAYGVRDDKWCGG